MFQTLTAVLSAAFLKRYLVRKVHSFLEIRTLRHRVRHIPGGKTLRLMTPAPAVVHWSVDGWQTLQDTESRATGLGLWYVDLPTDALPLARYQRFPHRIAGAAWKDGVDMPRVFNGYIGVNGTGMQRGEWYTAEPLSGCGKDGERPGNQHTGGA